MRNKFYDLRNDNIHIIIQNKGYGKTYYELNKKIKEYEKALVIKDEQINELINIESKYNKQMRFFEHYIEKRIEEYNNERHKSNINYVAYSTLLNQIRIMLKEFKQ